MDGSRGDDVERLVEDAFERGMAFAGEYLGSFRHETKHAIGNALRSIQIASRKDVDDRKRSEALDTAEQSIMAISASLDSIRTVTRRLEETTHGGLGVGCSSLALLVESTANSYWVASPALQCDLEDWTGPEEARVAANSSTMSMIIYHLVTNAERYRSSTTSEVIVNMRWVRDGVELTVTNPGVTTTHENVASVTDLGWRSPHAISVSPGGLGFGLWIVKRLVETINGHFRYETERNRTVVTVFVLVQRS